MAGHPALDPDEVPPLTAEQLAEMRPAREVHTSEEFAALSAVRKRGRPVATMPKVPVTIRLDASTVAAFKGTGAGWQTRMNEALAAVAAGLTSMPEPTSDDPEGKPTKKKKRGRTRTYRSKRKGKVVKRIGKSRKAA